MKQNNRSWLPIYCDPAVFLPMVQSTKMVFAHPPYLFQDFVGKAISFLRGERARELGFELDMRTALPCKWKCSDESLYGVDLCLYAYTGHYPFDKGSIGGFFNEASVGAAVHHARTNLDFGGSHVGYEPGPDGGTFGRISRPLEAGGTSSDCGYLTALLAPFQEVYEDACDNILLCRPEGDRVLISVPNEFLQPSWSSNNIKLLVDLQTLTDGVVPCDLARPYTCELAGRSLFYTHPDFLDGLDPEARDRYLGANPASIGRHLTAGAFNIFDAHAPLRDDGTPEQRILPYVKHILADHDAPAPLKAAMINAQIEHNRLADCVRAAGYRPYSFASFTGVFIDLYDPVSKAYVNLFQPVGLGLKPAGEPREAEFTVAQIHDIFDEQEIAEPAMPLEGVLGYERPEHLLEIFTFLPGL